MLRWGRGVTGALLGTLRGHAPAAGARARRTARLFVGIWARGTHPAGGFRQGKRRLAEGLGAGPAAVVSYRGNPSGERRHEGRGLRCHLLQRQARNGRAGAAAAGTARRAGSRGAPGRGTARARYLWQRSPPPPVRARAALRAPGGGGGTQPGEGGRGGAG